MSASGLVPSLSWAGAGGATSALRLGGAMLLSLGVHAGAALLIDLPRGPAQAASGSVSVRLVAAPEREVLPPAPPASAAAAPPALTAPRVPAARAAVAGPPAVTESRVPAAQAAVRPLRTQDAGGAQFAAEPAVLRRATAPAVPAERRDTLSRAASARAAAAGAPVQEAPAAVAATSMAETRSPPRPGSRLAAPAAVAPGAMDRPAVATPQPEPARAPAPAGPRVTAAAPERRPPPAGAPAAALDALPPRPAAGNRAPEYPLIARRRGQEGRVLLRLEVAPDGTPSASSVVRSSGVAALDRAARDAVARWRFQPARRGGRAVAATVEVPVVFRLDERG